MNDETRAVADRYARRAGTAGRYSALQPDVWQTLQERQRAVLQLLARQGWADLAALRVTEVGCGSGGNLLDLLRLGFAPEHVTGLELLPERHMQARHVLPQAATVWLGDATAAPVAPCSQHLVLQFTVFSSLLDAAFQQRLADAMWSWLRPGGAVLWYDFTVDNPRNADVRSVPLARGAGAVSRGAHPIAKGDAAATAGARGVPAAPCAVHRLQQRSPAAHAPAGVAAEGGMKSRR